MLHSKQSVGLLVVCCGFICFCVCFAQVFFFLLCSDGLKFQHKIKENIFFTKVKADADISIEVNQYDKRIVVIR